MNRRSRLRAVTRVEPMLLAGLAGLAVLVVVGYVAFTANGGLPFATSYRITVSVPNADRLIKHDTVSIGGVRAGQVIRVDARPSEGGRAPYARVALALDSGVAPLPVDTAVRVRPGAVLGSSYVDLVPGTSDDTIPGGGRLGLDRATRAVQINDLFETFRAGTRRNLQRTLDEVGGGLQGRGPALNELIGELAAVMEPLRRVSAALDAPVTRLPGFIEGLRSATAALAPAAEDLAGLVTGGAETFGALAGERAALRDTLQAFPPAATSTTRAFRALRPGLAGLADVATDLRPAGPRIAPALSAARRTLAAGEPPLRLLPRASARLGDAADAVRTTAADGSTLGSARKLTELFTEADTFLSAFVPAQLGCNLIPLWARIGEVFGPVGSGNGPGLVQIWFTTIGASGELLQSKEPASDLGNNFTPNANLQECESGNELYTGKQALDSPPGLQSSKTLETRPPDGALDRARDAGLLDHLGDGK